MLADELKVLTTKGPLWDAAAPLLERAQKLEQSDTTYSWHGWRRDDIEMFLKRLPEHCTVLVGVWEAEGTQGQVSGEEGEQEHEALLLGCVCEVKSGEIASLRTFEALTGADLPPVEQMEPSYQHALELMRAARTQIAPVAWALFTDKTTWDEWLFAEGEPGQALDKGELLASLARQGRCVLLS